MKSAAAVAALSATCGCTGPAQEAGPPPTQAAGRPPANSVTLKVAVEDDPRLASAIGLLAGEWREVSGGGLEVVPLGPAGLSDLKSDLVVFAPVRLGELCELGALRPVRESVLRSQELAWEDIYPAVRDKLLAFGGRSMALPIGCVAPLALAESESAPGWSDLHGGRLRPAWRLLARAAPLASHELRDSVLFDAETMAPALDQPPLLEALEQLVAAGKSGAAARLVMPSRAADPPATGAPPVHPSQAPGAQRFFHPIRGEWLPAEGRRAGLLGADGRLVGVTTASRNAAAAFRLAAWLAGKGNARQLAAASDHVANVRRSSARRPDDWLGRGDAGAGREFATALDATLGEELQLVVPRIIDAEAYLAALDQAVTDAESGRATPAEALATAAQAWEDSTERVGRDRQRQCYLRSLGVLQYSPPAR